MRKSIENCKDMHLDEHNVLRNSNQVGYTNSSQTEAGFDISLIGFDKNGDILAVTNYDWTIIKIKNAEFESLGKLDNTFRTVRDNPRVLLEEAQVMSMEEIERMLGHKIILKEMMK